VAAGPRAAVQLEVPPALAKQLAASGFPVPAPVTGTALIDTGATRSAIDRSVVARLGLNPIGLVTLGTAGGTSVQALYPLKLVLQQINSTVEFESVTGCDLGATDLVMLIGRDVLRLRTFTYDGVSGQYSLAM
jgi:predicted aspartyl protease